MTIPPAIERSLADNIKRDIDIRISDLHDQFREGEMSNLRLMTLLSELQWVISIIDHHNQQEQTLRTYGACEIADMIAEDNRKQEQQP